MASCSGDSQQDQISLPPQLEVSFPITEVGGAERCNLKDEESDHYPMESIPQGQCLILNVAHFLQHKERIGSDIDAEKLQNLFQNILNFVVTRVDDPTLPELQQRLQTFFQMDHSAYDAFFIIILSHGDPGDVIYTSDSQSIKISEISDHFTASNCPTLANKPKVFIVQACRGQKHHTPVVATVSHSHRASQDQTILDEAAKMLCDDLHMANTFTFDTEMTRDEQTANLDVTMSHTTSPHSGSQHDDPKSHNMSHDGGGFSTHNSNTTIQTIPDKKDFYYAFATIDDHEALRHHTDGSWFINEFVIAVKQFAHKYGHVYLQELMRKVTGRLSTHSYENRMQVCEVKSSNAKKIILSINTKNGPISSPPSEASSLHSLLSAGEMVESNRPSLPSSRSCSKSSSRHKLVLIATTPPLSPFIPKADTWSADTWNIFPTVKRSFCPSETYSETSLSNISQNSSLRGSRASSHHDMHFRPFIKSDEGLGSSVSTSFSSLHTSSSSNYFTGFQHQYSETQSHSPSRSHSITSSLSEALQPSSEPFSLKPGYCIVLNNNYPQYNDEKMERIRGVFSDQLGFHVQVYISLTRKGIKRLLKTVAKINHSDLSFLVVILLLGKKKPKNLEIRHIVKPFGNFEGIPKIFFFETKLNEKGYASFYNELVPVNNIPLSYVHIFNAKTEIEETFLQHLLQNIAATRISADEIIFQSIMKSTQDTFTILQLQSKYQIHFNDNLTHDLVLKQLKSHIKDDQEQEPGNDFSDHKNTELILALRLLSLIRDTTISLLNKNRDSIMQVCKSLQISEGRPATIKQAGTALALRTTLRLSEGPVRSTQGRSLAVSFMDKFISMAKLEEVKAALEVDKQLMQQVNRLMVECNLITPGDVLTLPPELSELISSCIKLYKISEGEAMAGFDQHVGSMFDQYVKVKHKIQKKLEEPLKGSKIPTEELLPEEVILHWVSHVGGGERMKSAFSLTSLTGSDEGGGLLMKTHAEGAFGYLKELTVTSSGMTYHCSQYGVTLIIPEGTIEDSATIWFGASLYSDKFHFGDYVPVTPIVWVYINQKLMKPAELYLPHHVNDNDSATKSKLTLLTANDESFPKLSFQVAGEDFIMEVQSGLCRIKCYHFCSSCVAINMTEDKMIRKIYMIAMAMKQEDNLLTYQFCIFPSQMACKKLVEEQCSKSGLTLNCFECIEFNNEQITVDFDPDQVAGWKRDQDGFFTENKISEKKANYFEVMGCKDRPVTKQDIENLEVMQDTLLYPPRLCFKFRCIDIHVAQTETQVKAIIKGGSDIPLQLNINLSLTDLIPTSPVNTTPENLPHNISLKNYKIFAKILKVVLEGIKEENEWFYLGLALGLSIPQLHSIEKNYCTEKCAREVLIEWKSQNEISSCNWKPVVDALREIGFDKLADQVESCLKEPEEATANSGGQSDTNDGQTHSQSQTTGLDITDLDEVMETLKEVHFGAAKWNDLGLSLGIYQTNLNAIKYERGDSNSYLRETIELWLQCQDKVNEKGGATWENLIKAVESTGDKAAADRLREKLNLYP